MGLKIGFFGGFCEAAYRPTLRLCFIAVGGPSCRLYHECVCAGEARVRPVGVGEHIHHAYVPERHYGLSNGRAFQSLADCPVGRPLFAFKHKSKQLIRERGVVAERKCFEPLPVHYLVLPLSWPPMSMVDISLKSWLLAARPLSMAAFAPGDALPIPQEHNADERFA